MVVLRTIIAVVLLALCIIFLGITIKTVVASYRKTVKNLNIHCKECGKRLSIPHPIDGSRMIVSESYVKGFNYCRRCLTEHCLDTRCSECTIKDKKNCSFHKTKRELMEELV